MKNKFKLALLAWLLLDNFGQIVARFQTLAACQASIELRDGRGQCMYSPD